MIVPCIRKQNDWSTIGVSGLNNLLINLMIMKSWFSREPFEWEQSKCICGFITYTCKWGNDVLDMLPGITIFQRLVFMLFFTTAYDNIISQNYNAIIHMYRILIYLPRNTMNCTTRRVHSKRPNSQFPQSANIVQCTIRNRNVHISGPRFTNGFSIAWMIG